MGEVLRSRSIYQGRVVRLRVDRVRLPNGAEADLEVIEHPGACAALPFVTEDEVVLIRQHRHCTGGEILEVPAGTLRPGESPGDCARREIEEETGYRAGRLEPLGWIWTTPGFTTEKIHLFAAYDLAPGRVSRDPDEVISIERMALREAMERAARGDITDGKTIATLFRAGVSQRSWAGGAPAPVPGGVSR